MRNREKDIDLDASRLDKAIGHVLGILDLKAPDDIDDPENAAAIDVSISRQKLDACKALVPLLERRAALLGLDAPASGKEQSPSGAGTLAELEQKLALAARAGGAGKSS